MNTLDLDFYSYEPVDLNDELFLSEVPMDLIKDSIENQFNDPFSDRKRDYIQPFITKYEYSVENGVTEDQYIYEEIFEDFVHFLENLFEEKLNISFPTLNDLQNEDVLELLHLTYRFFILGVKKNITTVMKNYLDKHRDKIVKLLNKKNDITSLNFRLELDDEDDVLILSNMNLVVIDIISHIVDKYDVDKFLNMCMPDKINLELEYVEEKYDDYNITGNFVGKYMKLINTTDFRHMVESKLRNHILKKYANKRKKNK